jgi:hypothetical protein
MIIRIEQVVHAIWKRGLTIANTFFCSWCSLWNGKGLVDSECLHIESVNILSLLGPAPEACDETVKYALIPLSDEYSRLDYAAKFYRAFTCQIDGVTTIQVDVLDTARHVSMGYYSLGKGGLTVGNGTS